MRTTLDIPDPLFREVKTRAVQQGVTLKELLAQYIRAGMDAPSESPPSRALIPLPYFRKAAGPVVPARTNAELFAILEEEDIAKQQSLVARSQPEP